MNTNINSSRPYAIKDIEVLATMATYTAIRNATFRGNKPTSPYSETIAAYKSELYVNLNVLCSAVHNENERAAAAALMNEASRLEQSYKGKAETARKHFEYKLAEAYEALAAAAAQDKKNAQAVKDNYNRALDKSLDTFGESMDLWQAAYESFLASLRRGYVLMVTLDEDGNMSGVDFSNEENSRIQPKRKDGTPRRHNDGTPIELNVYQLAVKVIAHEIRGKRGIVDHECKTAYFSDYSITNTDGEQETEEQTAERLLKDGHKWDSGSFADIELREQFLEACGFTRTERRIVHLLLQGCGYNGVCKAMGYKSHGTAKIHLDKIKSKTAAFFGISVEQASEQLKHIAHSMSDFDKLAREQKKQATLEHSAVSAHEVTERGGSYFGGSCFAGDRNNGAWKNVKVKAMTYEDMVTLDKAVCKAFLNLFD